MIMKVVLITHVLVISETSYSGYRQIEVKDENNFKIVDDTSIPQSVARKGPTLTESRWRCEKKSRLDTISC